jgi:hypothetical protein
MPDKLTGMREIQNWGKSFGIRTPEATSPNMCIAASKFLVGRLAGLYPESAGHLNDFLGSAQARKLAPTVNMRRLMSLWGHPEHAFDATVVADFNAQVLPALIEWGGARGLGKVKFVVLKNCPANKGDELLRQQVPLVVGVHYADGKYHGSGRNNHFVTIVKGSSGDVWVVDSWGSEDAGAVKRIRPTFAPSFQIPFILNLNVNGPKGYTVIPGTNRLFGYFDQDGAPMKLAISL